MAASNNPFFVEPANVLQALMLGVQGYDASQKRGKENELKAARTEAAALMADGNHQGALSRLMSAGDIQGATLLNTMYQQTPGALAERERATQTVQAEFAPRTTNIKTPDGDEVTVEKGPGGYKLPQIQGMPTSSADAGMFIPPGVDKKTYRKQRSTQLANIDDKAVLAADTAVQAGGAAMTALDRAIELNKTAFHGPLADQRGYYAALTGKGGGADTLTLKNVITSQALEQLKLVFGGMPTEGERKILIEVQGSVDQPQGVRAGIFERAKEAAQARTEFNKKNAEDMRSGQYLIPQSQRQPQAALQQQAGQPVQISTPAERNALRKGTPYIAPDGSLRTKQ